MRFMVIVKATKDTENEGAPPDPQLMADMNKFNDELLEAGVLLGYEWVKRCPNPHEGDTDMEIHQILEPEDFASAFNDEEIQKGKKTSALKWQLEQPRNSPTCTDVSELVRSVAR